ncbi:MAG TPA: hypothetical protein VJS44_03740 [Pyrinomonadaceae bacterium]|nr:hypothetical protein [Pyrinomonadaceae bacterium]
MKLSIYLAAFLSLLSLSVNAHAQGVVPLDADRWEIEAKESKFVDHMGRRSLYLKGGVAAVKGSQFTDGVLEFDIAFTEERGFMGAVWRLQDFENYEEFYIRPHQSGNPDANQYQPVFNGVAAWQLYYGDGYGAPVRYDFNQWTHVRIVVSGKQAEVYIKDMTTPALFVSELKREVRQGRVGLSAGNFAPGYYSNFSFTPMSSVALKGKPKAAAPAPAGTVASWLVSNLLDGKSLEGKYQLTAEDKERLKWRRLDSESTGICNLARLQGVSEGRDTVFARLVIQSEREQVKKVRFGFSDSVKVYFNDRLLYGGSDVYQSRDYRFLGTTGLFDELYLSLKQGDNELWLAVTENFGGWGVRAAFDDTTGIRIK